MSNWYFQGQTVNQPGHQDIAENPKVPVQNGTYDKSSYNCVRDSYHCPSTVCQIQDEPTTFYMLKQIQELKQAIVLIYAGTDVRPPVELITGDWITEVADLQVNKEPSTVSEVSRAKI